MPCVVADTSPLFYLARLGRLELLKELYLEIIIPEAVWEEAWTGRMHFPEIEESLQRAVTQNWLLVHAVKNHLELLGLQDLDPGEREAIYLAMELKAGLLIIDEQKGRGAARDLGLQVTGTLGVLVEAKKRGLITMLSPILDQLRQTTSFRFSQALQNQILVLVGEIPIRPDSQP